MIKNIEHNGSQLNDVFCLSANFIFQHEPQRQKILFKVLLTAGTVQLAETLTEGIKNSFKILCDGK